MKTGTIAPSGPLGNALTTDQRGYFERNGVLHIPGFLDRGTVSKLWEACVAIQTQWIAEDKRKVNGSPLKWGNDVDGSRIVQRFSFANQFSPVLEEFLKDPRFNVLLDLVGPDARLGVNEKDGLVVNHYVNTGASKFKRMGWHTDSVRDLFLNKKLMPMLNVGIHLDDQDPRNGGLRVLPGTHEQNVWNVLFRKAQFLSHRPDEREVGFEIKAGDLTIHDGRCWHRVEQSKLVGEASRRRVMYIPIISGEYMPKSATSPTPFYHRFHRLTR